MTEKFGAGVMIYGTLFTGFIAILVALPMSFGIAFFLTEIAPPKLRRPIGMAIQLLAAVPSIIYGMWGFFVVVPLIAHYLAAAADRGCSAISRSSAYLFKGPPLGSGMLTAGLILAFMIIPFITAMFVEIIECGAADAEGIGLWRRLRPPMRSSATFRCPMAARRWSAPSCSASAARSARPWR